MGLSFDLVRDYRTAFHHPTHIVDGHVDVRQRIAFDGDKVGKITRSHGAEFLFLAKEFGSVGGSRAQRLFRRDSGLSSQPTNWQVG